MPVKGWPMKLPWKRCSRNRPPRAILFSEVPSDSVGGAVGDIHDFTLAVQVPSIVARPLWALPGVAAACHASMMALSSTAGAAAFLAASWAEARPARPAQSNVGAIAVSRIGRSLSKPRPESIPRCGHPPQEVARRAAALVE